MKRTRTRKQNNPNEVKIIKAGLLVNKVVKPLVGRRGEYFAIKSESTFETLQEGCAVLRLFFYRQAKDGRYLFYRSR